MVLNFYLSRILNSGGGRGQAGGAGEWGSFKGGGRGGKEGESGFSYDASAGRGLNFLLVHLLTKKPSTAAVTCSVFPSIVSTCANTNINECLQN
jgi:hypothetical protein